MGILNRERGEERKKGKKMETADGDGFYCRTRSSSVLQDSDKGSAVR